MTNRDIHQAVTDSIIAKIRASIDAGKTVAPWQKPWAAIVGAPKGASGKEYRGINIFLLAMQGYSNPYWFTFNKVRSLKGSVKKGEKGTIVVFWNFIRKINKATGEEKKVAFLKYYRVFNFEQCEKLPEKYAVKTATREIQPIPAAEAIVNGWKEKPTINGNATYASYSPSLDLVKMPPRASFTSDEGYFTTLFHELVHSTGHASRLARLDGATYGSNNRYAFEELVAEMGAAMLAAHAGIDAVTGDNSVSYLAGWLSALQDNPDWLVKAAGKAQKAVDLILGHSYDAAGDDEGEDSGEG